ncbi:Rrf2 family transcriptional regulator [Staphylococcus aureus]
MIYISNKLVGPLRNAGLIRSVRGAKGGYQLTVTKRKKSAGRSAPLRRSNYIC